MHAPAPSDRWTCTAPAAGLDAPSLPEPHGPFTDALFRALRSEPGTALSGPSIQQVDVLEDDVQLALTPTRSRSDAGTE